MVREVSDDKKNDSLEFNEFLKVRLLLSIMMMMVCVVMMIIFDVSSFNQMVALSLKREPSQNKRELLEAFRQFDKYYFNASGVELESWILKLPVSAFCIKNVVACFHFDMRLASEGLSIQKLFSFIIIIEKFNKTIFIHFAG